MAEQNINITPIEEIGIDISTETYNIDIKDENIVIEKKVEENTILIQETPDIDLELKKEPDNVLNLEGEVIKIDANYPQAIEAARVATEKAEEAKEVVEGFDDHAASKITEYDSNASDKIAAYNANAVEKTNAFNSNATSKTSDFNDNASSKTSDFNSNASSKTGDFNTNATSKTNTFNQNATDKTTAFNSNATEKTNDFNDNYTAKKAIIDGQVDLAKDWATKTDGTVDGVDYSAKYYAQSILPIASDITTVAGIASDVTTVSSISSDVTSVASNATDISTVADSISDVNSVGSNIVKVTAVADDLTNIDAVNANKTNIDTVASISSDVTTVSGIASDVTSVASNNTDISAVADDLTNINSVAGDLTNIDSVAGDLANIDAVNANKTNIDAVAGNNANITAVANNATNINAVAGNAANINAVNANKANIDTVAGISSDVSTVAGINTDITTVSGISSDVSSVASNNADISAVASNLTNIGNVASDLTNIDSVAGIAGDVYTVSSIASDVTAVKNNATNINTVASDIANINAVAGDLTNIDNASSYAQLAKDWANKTNGTVDGSEYSSKYYAEQAATLLSSKQDQLTSANAGTGISITGSGGNIQINNTQTSAEWGNITGTLSNQTDLQTALNAKYDASNPSGYITGITSSDVTTALGYTPYDSSNPNGYTSNVGTVTSVNNTSPDANGNVTISTGNTYTAGTGIDISNNTISVDNTVAMKTDIPAPVTETTVSGWGFTKNVGTVTSVNNTNPDANGNVSLTIPTVDQTYDGTSTNAQSGVAVAEALATVTVSKDNLSITENANNQLQTVGVINQNNTSTAVKTWTGTKAQYDAIATKDANTLYNINDDTSPEDIMQTILSSLYPVGSIYITTANTCPLSALISGSTWELVSSGRVLQGADSGHSAGTTIEAGLPNITGNIRTFENGWNPTECFVTSRQDSEAIKGSTNANMDWVYFDASRSNSIYGNSTTVQPPAYFVNIYRRTA